MGSEVDKRKSTPLAVVGVVTNNVLYSNVIVIPGKLYSKAGCNIVGDNTNNVIVILRKPYLKAVCKVVGDNTNNEQGLKNLILLDHTRVDLFPKQIF